MRIFLSSTATDLTEHRRVADDTLLRLTQQSVVMERFGALPGTPVDECERLAAEADAVVCIIAHRFGFEPERGRGSITRREVEAAHRAGKPVYAWIVDDKFPWAEQKEQDRLTDPDTLADPGLVQQVADAVRALKGFKDWLQRNVVTEAFTTPDDLGRKIATTLAQTASQRAKQPSYPAAPPRREPELRVVHALQPAPHFSGRDGLVAKLSAWVDDIASPDRVHAVVAPGGTGKTAVIEQVLRQLQLRWPMPGAGSVLVWSFYERPDADAFLRESAQLFLGEAEGEPPGGRLERLQRGLRDGRPHLMVLDGLERVQAEAGAGHVRGELEDHTLKLLLQAIAHGLGRTRALATSRFPLTDLRDWHNRGVVETALDDLAPQAAREVLRRWGVVGSDVQLDAVAGQVGRHALSVAVIGSYLHHFAEGHIEAAAGLRLDEVAGDDAKAAKLARVLGYYAEKLPADERELLTRLAVFPRGITLELLGDLVDAGGAVAGVLLNAKPALTRLLARLEARGLVFRYRSTDDTVTWTGHPFVRERFAGLLSCPATQVFSVVAERLGQGLDKRPEDKPRETALLDRYEQVIEATRLAGRTQEAFDLFWDGIGSFRNLGKALGDYARGYRVLNGFVPEVGRYERFGEQLTPISRCVGLTDLALFARRLGRLHEAIAIRAVDDALSRDLDEPEQTSIGLQNTSEVAIELGRLTDALRAAQAAEAEAVRANEKRQKGNSSAYRAIAAHYAGDIAQASAAFAAANRFLNEPMLYSQRGANNARHLLDCGDLAGCRAITEAGLAIAERNGWNHERPWWWTLLARLALAEQGDSRPHIADIRAWTTRTGDMAWVIEAHLLASRDALVRKDLPGARAEAEDGLLQARHCGVRLKEIELLTTLSAVQLAWPDAAQALAAARQALDLATAPECGYAWGEADAAHAWGKAFVALGQPDQARRAFVQALAVRERIGHPDAQATTDALARLG